MRLKLLALTALFLTIALMFCACAEREDKDTPSDVIGQDPEPSVPQQDTPAIPADPKPASVTVTFDYSFDGKKDALTVQEGTKIPEPERVSRENHIFNGWLAGTKTVSFPYEAKSDVTLRASWTYVDPYFYTQPASSVTMRQGDREGVECEVRLQKGHYFTYQWFMSDSADTAGATAVEGAVDRILSIPDSVAVGVHYFFCQVTARSFKTGEITDTFNSDLSRIEIKKGATNVLVVGSGTVRQDGKHDSTEFLKSLLDAGGYEMEIDTITRASNYNIWESGLTGDNQATVRDKLESKKYSYLILQMGRDYATCTQATRDKEIAAYRNILSMVEELAPDCEVILIEGPWRQDMTTKYYVDRFIPAGIDSNDKHKEAIYKLFDEHILPIREDVSICDMIRAFELCQQAGLNPYGDSKNDFPGTLGSYLLACMCYANITDQSPEGLSVTSDGIGSVKLQDAKTLQQIAAQVVLNK